MSNITVDFAQYTTDTTLNGPYNLGDNVTLADDSSVLDGLNGAQIAALITNNIDVISATDGVLSWTADQYAHLITGAVAIDPDTFAVLADTGADIAALSATQLGQIAAKGVASINPSDGVLTLHVAQFEALGAMSVDGSADFTISDTGANIATMDSGAMAALESLGVDHLNATDGVLALSIDQYQSLGTVALTAGNDVTLADTSANLEALSASDIASLGAGGIDHIHATDGAWTISLAVFDALGSVTLAPSDTVTLADSAATLSGFSTGDIDALAAGDVDILHPTEGTVSFNAAQLVEMANDGIHLVLGDTITLADTGANIAALSTSDIDGLAATGVDSIDATDDAVTISAAQFSHLLSNSISLTAGDTITVSDTSANLAALNFSAVATAGVDFLDATTAYTTLTAAQLSALGAVTFTDASAVTLTDTGAHIATVSDFSTFAAHGVDKLDASDNTLTISEAQFQALGSTTLTGSDTVTISDTGNNIVGGPNYGTLAAAGIDFLNATTAINITINDITNLGAVVFTSASAVTLTDTGAHIAAVANFTTFGTHGVDKIDASNNTLTMNATQYGELGSVTLTAADTVTISDSAAHLGGLSFSALAVANVDFVNSTNAYTNLTVQNVTDLGATHFTAASNVTLTDTAAHIQGVSDFTTFATHGVDTIKSSDNALSLAASQLSGLGTTHLTGADAVTLTDTSANLGAFLDSVGSGAILTANGVDTIHGSGGTLSIDAAAYNTVAGTGAVFTSGDSVTISDTAANLGGLTYSALAGKNVDFLNATNAISITTQNMSDLGIVHFTGASAVTLADSSTNIQGVADFASFAAHGVDSINATDDVLTISISQLGALDTTTLTQADTVTLADTQTNIQNLSGAAFNTDIGNGIDVFHSTSGSLTVSTSQLDQMIHDSGNGVFVPRAHFLGSDTVTWASTGADISSAGNIGTALQAAIDSGVDFVDATDDVMTLNTEQFLDIVQHGAQLVTSDNDTIGDADSNFQNLWSAAGLNGLLSNSGVDTISANDGNVIHITAAGVIGVEGSGAVLDSGETGILADTGANIAALTTTQLSDLLGINVTTIDASDNTLSLSLDQFHAAVNNGISLTAGDNITITGNLDNLSTTDIASFGANHVDHLIDVDGFNEVIWNTAQWNALATSVAVDNGGHVAFSNFVFDSWDDLSAVTVTQVAHFVAEGATIWETQPPGDPGQVSWTVDKVQAMGSSVWSSGTNIWVVDSAAHIQAVSDFSTFSAHGIQIIDSTDDTLSLTAAQFGALGNTTLNGADAVTLADTASNLNTYFATFADSASLSSVLSSNGVDTIHITGSSISVATLVATGVQESGAIFSSGDTVTVADTGANLVSFIDAMQTASVNLATLGIDHLDATDNTLTLNVSEFGFLQTAGVTLTAGDTVTIHGTAANISGLTYAALAAAGIDLLDATTAISVTAAQLTALGVVGFTSASTVTLSDTGAHIATENFATIAARGIDTIDASDNVLSISVTQYNALGAMSLTQADVITLADTGANIAALTAMQIAALAAAGIDKIDVSNNVMSLSVAQFAALGTVTLIGGDTITLLDTGANLQTLNFSSLASKGVDILDASDNVLNLTAAQFQTLGTVSLKSTDTVTLLDSGAHISALTVGQFNALAAKGIDILDATDNAYSLTVAKVEGMSAALTLAANDTVTVQDSEANIEGMSHAQLAAAVARGVDIFHASNSTLNVSVAQAGALLGTGAAFASGDTVTLIDTAANIQALNSVQMGALAAIGIDTIDASDNALTLSLSQYRALGSVTLTHTDTVILQNDNNGLSGMTVSEIQTLSAGGVDILESTNGNFSFSVAQAEALIHQTGGGTVSLSGGDTFFINDTNVNLSTLTAGDVTALGALGAGTVDIIASGTIAISVAAYDLVVGSGITLDAGDSVALTDTGANIGALTSVQLAALAGNNIDFINATNNAITFNKADLDALGAVTLVAGDTITMRDTEAHLEALTGTQFGGYAAQQVDVFSSLSGILALNENQVVGVLNSAAMFSAADTVTLADTAANLEALSAAQFGKLTAKGVDIIDVTSGTLSLSVAQFNALHQVVLTDSDTVVLADTGAHIASLSAAVIGALGANGIDVIDASNNAITFNIGQYNALGSMQIAADDVLKVNGTAGDDVFQAVNGTQTLNGLDGNDTFSLGAGNHTINGGAGIDTVSYAAATSGVSINLITGTATTGAWTDGFTGIENVTGSNLSDTITGNSGENVINGGSGDDILIGGGASDTLTGGAGADRFVYQSTSNSTGVHSDTIMDFSHAEGDKIDVSAIAPFTFVDSLSHQADQLAIIDMGGNLYKVVGDVNGDGVADLAILVHSSTTLVAGDFIL